MRRALMTEIGLCVVFAFIVASAGCITIGGDNLQGKAKRTDQRHALRVGSASALNVTTNVGEIKLDAADAAEVRITAEITVKAKTEEEAQALLEGVRIVAEPSGETLMVKAEKPSGFGRNQLAVDFTITAPAALRLDCTTNVGDIRVNGFTSAWRPAPTSAPSPAPACATARACTRTSATSGPPTHPMPPPLSMSTPPPMSATSTSRARRDLRQSHRRRQRRRYPYGPAHHRQRLARQVRQGLARQRRRPGGSPHQRRLHHDPVEPCHPARSATANPAPATHSAGGSTFKMIRSNGVLK